MKRFLDKPYMEGICPCCGSQIEYGQRNHMDNGGTIAWECPNCEASGEEGFDEVFDGMHYNVSDAQWHHGIETFNLASVPLITLICQPGVISRIIGCRSKKCHHTVQDNDQTYSERRCSCYAACHRR